MKIKFGLFDTASSFAELGVPIFSPSVLRLISLILLFVGLTVAGIYNLVLSPAPETVVPSIITIIGAGLIVVFTARFAARFYGLSVLVLLLFFLALTLVGTSIPHGFGHDESVFNVFWIEVAGALLYGGAGLLTSISFITIVSVFFQITSNHLTGDFVIAYWLIFIMESILLTIMIWVYQKTQIKTAILSRSLAEANIARAVMQREINELLEYVAKLEGRLRVEPSVYILLKVAMRL